MTQNVNLPTTTTYQPEPAYQAPAPAPASYFTDMAAFEGAQRVAKMLAASDMVPKQYQNNVANTVLALEVALQTRSSPFFVMQNLNVIQGKPGWNAQFITALLNASGRFKGGLRYETDDDDNPTRCRVWAIDAATGERLNGPTVTLEMARREGWTNRPGSKWQTMPEVMLGYRAATFFGRRHAPELLLGMRTDDELDDIGPDAFRRMNGEKPGAAVEVPPARPKGAAAIDELLAEVPPETPDEAGNPPENAGQSAEDSSSPAAPRNNGDEKAEPEKGKKKESAGPDGEDGGAPEEYRAMLVCIAEIDGIDDPEALRSWWQGRDYQKTVAELGGMNSEWHLSVVEHLNARIKELEQDKGDKTKKSEGLPPNLVKYLERKQ